MSDARALLRQQRAARRITHPYAAYSDTGKLLCTLCREQVKAENLWDAHLQSPGHRKRVDTAPPPASKEEADEEESAAAAPSTSHKRKIDDDEAMEDADDNAEAMTRRKRSRPDLGRETIEETAPKGRSLSLASNGINGTKDQDQTLTPPSLTRRSSATPSQGVEVQIPSRPATPRESNTNSASTTRTLPSRQASSILQQGPPISSSTPANLDDQTQKPPPTTRQASDAKKANVNEDEWAAFEADIAAASYDDAEATISAPAMTAAEAEAAKGEAEEDDGDPRRRTSKPEAALAEEREDARRAIEVELDEMHNLEAKVLKFKEQRDALRRQRAESQGQQDNEGNREKAQSLVGKENVGNSVAVVEEGEEEEEDEDDEDDWDGFRFRTGLTR